MQHCLFYHDNCWWPLLFTIWFLLTLSTSLSVFVCGSDRLFYSHAVLSRLWPRHLVLFVQRFSIFFSLPPPAHRLNLIMKTSLENHCTLTEVQRQRTLIVVKVGLFSPRSLWIKMHFTHISLADPLLLSPTLRCETDRTVRPLAKVNQVLNCVWALHHHEDQTPSQSSRWQLSANKTLLPLLSLPRLTVNCIQHTADLILLQAQSGNFPVWTSIKLPTFIRGIDPEYLSVVMD